MNQIDLNDRCAIVPGAAQGIGLAIARRLLASGVIVSLWDRDADLLLATVEKIGKSKTVSHEIVDVSDPQGLAAAASTTIQKYGKIDILVANAGPNHKSWEYPIDAWKQIIDINLTGVFLCCHAIVPYMLQQNYGDRQY
ncbi:MAG TPA: SDR family NAD(P)-dependent oxidoreductase [Candidatus Dormibacteraeota bacterium]|jgi:NAD(P)-dependent dehydrogenase (short-subunit alcohol dehydrogenase family)|nr:SDR family NAD(P)-dependent oxidoreductase [Candidatus Dormibacteraeota bacterium]